MVISKVCFHAGIIILLISTQAVLADAPDGKGSIINITQTTYHSTIQEAIDTSTNGDEIVVAPGTYYEHLDMKGRAITLRSSDNADSTIIHGSSSGTVISCVSGETSNTIIKGFTITGAAESGLRIFYQSNPTIVNCSIRDNSSNWAGGGIFIYDGNPTLVNCLILDNSADIGGGIKNGVAEPLLINCTLVGNSAVYGGGGIYNDTSGHPVVSNCILWDNSGYQIYNESGSATVSASCIQGGYSGTGNIAFDPLFAASDDFHLQEESPCVNTGNNDAIPSGITTDYDGSPRIQNCFVDIGAYESAYVGDDCNSNGIPDACDIEVGTSLDCNGNKTPDECDLLIAISQDCNSNLIPDECDIAAQTSQDLNPADTIPDECQGIQLPTGACCLFGACIVSTELACQGAGGVYQGDDNACLANTCGIHEPADIDGDGDVDLSDFALFQTAFTGPTY